MTYDLETLVESNLFPSTSVLVTLADSELCYLSEYIQLSDEDKESKIVIPDGFENVSRDGRGYFCWNDTTIWRITNKGKNYTMHTIDVHNGKIIKTPKRVCKLTDLVGEYVKNNKKENNEEVPQRKDDFKMANNNKEVKTDYSAEEVASIEAELGAGFSSFTDGGDALTLNSSESFVDANNTNNTPKRESGDAQSKSEARREQRKAENAEMRAELTSEIGGVQISDKLDKVQAYNHRNAEIVGVVVSKDKHIKAGVVKVFEKENDHLIPVDTIPEAEKKAYKESGYKASALGVGQGGKSKADVFKNHKELAITYKNYSKAAGIIVNLPKKTYLNQSDVADASGATIPVIKDLFKEDDSMVTLALDIESFPIFNITNFGDMGIKESTTTYGASAGVVKSFLVMAKQAAKGADGKIDKNLPKVTVKKFVSVRELPDGSQSKSLLVEGAVIPRNSFVTIPVAEVMTNAESAKTANKSLFYSLFKKSPTTEVTPHSGLCERDKTKVTLKDGVISSVFFGPDGTGIPSVTDPLTKKPTDDVSIPVKYFVQSQTNAGKVTDRFISYDATNPWTDAKIENLLKSNAITPAQAEAYAELNVDTSKRYEKIRSLLLNNQRLSELVTAVFPKNTSGSATSSTIKLSATDAIKAIQVATQDNSGSSFIAESVLDNLAAAAMSVMTR